MHKNTKHIFVRLLLAIIVLFFSSTAIAQQKKFKVVIDAGHGGKDSGSIGTGKMKKKEKDIALAVALLVNQKLKNDPHIQPILTRKSDRFLELWERAEIANKNKADLFISIHCNANKSPKPKGSETFVLGIHRNKDNLNVAKKENSVIKLEKNNHLKYEGFDPDHPESFIGLSLMQEEFLDQSIYMASLIQKQYEKYVKNIKDRSVQQAGFAVLRLTYMPSVLTEIGFLTNPQEEKFLNSKAGQNKIAQSIVDAVKEYYRFIRANSQVPEVDTNTTASENNSEVIFKVQLAASSKKIPLKPENFNGLTDLSMTKNGRWYKYYTGHSNDIQKIRLIQREAHKKNYATAFIVAFKNGKRISLQEALKK